MLEEVGLPYRVVPVDIGKGEQFEPDFLKISPNNKIPAIVDRDEAVSLMESGAILIYLAEKTGRLLPPSGPGRWQVLQWLMMQMGSVGPMLGQAHHFLYFNKGKSRYAEERYRNESIRIYRVLDRRLAESEYLAGEYSIADVATWPWIARHPRHEMGLDDYPHLRRWYLQVAGRPAVQRGYRVAGETSPIPIPE